MPRRRRTETPAAAAALAGAAPLATRWVERLLAAHDPPLTLAQFLALRALAAAPATGAELARRAGVTGAAVSQLVAALSAAGWVEGAPRADARARPLQPTPAGRRILERASTAVASRLDEALRILPPAERDALARALPLLESALAGEPAPRRPTPRRRPPPPRP